MGQYCTDPFIGHFLVVYSGSLLSFVVGSNRTVEDSLR